MNPSGRPFFPGELWTMSCETQAGKVLGTRQISIGRGQRVQADWSGACRPKAP